MDPGLTMAVRMNQGTARPIRISNTFDPMELDTAISPRPKAKVCIRC